MKNPRTSAIIGVIGVVLTGSAILFHGDEAPSAALATLEWILLGLSVLGLVGSLIQLSKTN